MFVCICVLVGVLVFSSKALGTYRLKRKHTMEVRPEASYITDSEQYHSLHVLERCIHARFQDAFFFVFSHFSIHFIFSLISK